MSETSDPFLVDYDQLEAMASAPIIQRGLGYFKEDRVVDLSWEADGARVWGAVDGTAQAPYQVTIEWDDELLFECTCPFEWEPVCKHAVAVLLAYRARQPISEETAGSAIAEAIAARVQRGATEVAIKGEIGKDWPSIWSAWSVATPDRRYRVEMRARDERINTCSCADFATNRLGTCKHIEAVAHRLRKRKRRAGPVQLERPLVFVDWAGAQPEIRLRRAGNLAPETDAVLRRYFDDGGRLLGLPADVLTLIGALAGHTVLVGNDVRQYAERAVRIPARQAEAARVRDEIRRGAGHLSELHTRLYPYQVEGVGFLVGAQRAILADDMGLGKTLQAIAATHWLIRNRGVRRALVICPASLKHQWAREIERFTGHTTQVVQGPPATRLAQYRAHANFTLVNYELVLRDKAQIAQIVCPDVLILDEAQRIKNWRTKTAEAVKRIPSRYAFVLTGTPLENRLEDLYSLMQVVDPHVLGPLWRFLLQFHVLGERGEVLGYRNLSELRERLASVLVRRDRRLVRDQLPDRIEHRRQVKLSSRQRALHDEALQSAAVLGQIAKRRPLSPPEQQRLLAALQNARMACNAAGLVDKETEGSPKLDELAQLLESLCIDGDHKVVVFSQWERMTQMAQAVAERLGLGVVRLHGGVPTVRRPALIERFRDDPGVQVFLSTDAGGVGLNLQAATALINLDIPWNPAVLEQRIARIHRLGQRAQVQVVLLVAENAYEERVAALVASKRALFVNTLTDEASEDVLGVSKRVFDLAVEAMGPATGAGGGDDDSAEETADAARAPRSPTEEQPSSTGSAPGGARQPGDDISPAITALVARIQTRFEARIERIVGAGGSLLVVLRDPPTVADLAWVDTLDSRDVALIEASGFGVVRRMLGDVQTVDHAVPVTPSRYAIVERKLRAAEALVAADCAEEATALIAESVRLTVAASIAQPPPPAERFPAWLFGEAVSCGLSTDLANDAVRIHAMATSVIPPQMSAALLGDARALIEMSRQSA